MTTVVRSSTRMPASGPALRSGVASLLNSASIKGLRPSFTIPAPRARSMRTAHGDAYQITKAAAVSQTGSAPQDAFHRHSARACAVDGADEPYVRAPASVAIAVGP